MAALVKRSETSNLDGRNKLNNLQTLKVNISADINISHRRLMPINVNGLKSLSQQSADFLQVKGLPQPLSSMYHGKSWKEVF